jgi:hypothetical protein
MFVSIERDHAVGSPGHVQREGAVIAEAVQGATARQRANERPIVPLVQERAGLLSVPGRRQIPYAVLPYFNGSRDLSREQLVFQGEALLLSQRHIVSRQHAVRTGGCEQRRNHVRTELFQPRAHDLNHDPPVVAVAHQRWNRVALAVNEPVGVGVGRDAIPAAHAGGDAVVPPLFVEGRIGVTVKEAQADLGPGAPQGNAHRLPARVPNPHRAGPDRWAMHEVAAEYPWMALLPPVRPLGGYGGLVRTRSAHRVPVRPESRS